jgi:hypothetical protein
MIAQTIESAASTSQTVTETKSASQLSLHKVAVMTQEGLQISEYGVGDWLEYKDSADNVFVGRVSQIVWSEDLPDIRALYSHWTGDMISGGFKYELYSPFEADFMSFNEVDQEDILRLVEPERATKLEQDRLQELEDSRLINIVIRIVKENGGKMPDQYWEKVPKLLKQEQ